MRKTSSIRRATSVRRRLDANIEQLTGDDEFEEVTLYNTSTNDRPFLKRTLTAQFTQANRSQQAASTSNINLADHVTSIPEYDRSYSASMENLRIIGEDGRDGTTARYLSSSSLPASSAHSQSEVALESSAVMTGISPLQDGEDRDLSTLENQQGVQIAHTEDTSSEDSFALSTSPEQVRLDHATRQEHIPIAYPTVTKSKSERKASAKALAKDLRPVIDYRIEALPISKEKEALLTCTRPTYLPPKSRKEEKKHLKEFEKLMYGSLEAEKRYQKRKSKALVQKARHLTNSADTWANHILPHFATAVKDPYTKTLWWSGLPNRVRGEIWTTCVGNTLAINAETFKLALTKSEQIERELKTHTEDDDRNDQLLTAESYELLENSVAQTFVELKIFRPGGPLHLSLVQVLKAYLYYRQDVMVSYVEGVNYIAGLLLMYLPPVQTFVTLANVLNRSLPLALYTKDEPILNRFTAVFLSKLGERLPRLHKHLHEHLHLAPLMYLEPMLVSLLARQAPPDVSARIFDIYAFEGDAFLIRAVIAVFQCLEHALYGSASEVLAVLRGEDKEHTWEKNLHEEDFIRKCKSAF